MSLINMLQPWQWALLAIVPPAIVLLYFLKLKRTPLEVPSTYLWRKSIEDLHVNSIWQRLRTSLLLFLQLLLVLLVMMALVRPGWSGSELTGTRFVLLVDNSASMQATDVEPMRLAEAKRRAADLIGQMKSGDVAMIVSFADTARVEQAFTDNRRELLERLAAIQPTNRPTSFEEALRVASGLAQVANAQVDGATDEGSDTAAGQAATLFVLSDGRFAGLQQAKLGRLRVVYVPIGFPAPENLAITAFSTRPREDDKQRLQAFGRVQNFGPREVATDVELFHNGALLDTSKLNVPVGDSAGVVFNLGTLASGTLELRIGTDDVLAVDNRAWAAIEPPKKSRVLVVSAGNDALALALRTESVAELADVEIATPETLATRPYQQRADEGDYDLIVYDHCAPSSMPRANTLFLGTLPGDGVWSVAAEKVTAPQVIDVDATHPLMQLIDLSNVRFAEAQVLQPPRGASVLVSTTAGPLLAIAPRGSFEDAVLAAPLVGVDEQGERFANTDWPLRVSFPVFVLNAINYLGGDAQRGGIPSVRPGEAVSLGSAGTSDAVRVQRPDGSETAVARIGGQATLYGETDQMGVYQVSAPGVPARHFVVNLFDPAESNVAPREEIEIGYEEVAGQANWEGGRTELWRPLLIAVLVVLCVEWYIYNRRIYV